MNEPHHTAFTAYYPIADQGGAKMGEVGSLLSRGNSLRGQPHQKCNQRRSHAHFSENERRQESSRDVQEWQNCPNGFDVFYQAQNPPG